MAESGEKKTLKLGVKIDSKLGDRIQGSMKSVQGGRAHVVVVSKNTAKPGKYGRGFAGVAGAASGGASQNLTDSEQQRRLRVLQEAESAKRTQELLRKKEEEEKRSIAELRAKEKEMERRKAPEVGSATVHEDVIVHHKKVQVRERERPASTINLDDLLKKGKMRNLDSLYRAPKVQEENTIVIPDFEQPGSKPANRAAAKPLDYGRKAAVDEDGEVVAHKKIKDVEKRGGGKKSFAAFDVVSGDEDGVVSKRRSLASIKRAKEKARRKMEGVSHSAEKIVREVMIPDVISVQELSNRMTEKVADVIKALMGLGLMVTVNQVIDADTAEIVVGEFGHRVKRVTEAEIEAALLHKEEDREEDLVTRAPVVTVMGHVDHGKTSLLDALRNTDVAAGEAGGITQHIGAYKVKLANGREIAFLDTPGHEAFTAMRMRGAKVTDIVVLVVAADDGIMQQTVEALNHAKAAGVPIIVAINKIDKPDANPQKVKQELLQYGVVPESMGGDSIVVEVSAKKKINLEQLEEMILLQADVLDLKANPKRLAEGAVIEAQIDKKRGVLATFLVQKGTIKIGDIVVAGSTWGKVRALINDKSQNVDEAGPSMPIEVWGLESAPVAGDDFLVVSNEKSARDIVALRLERDKQKKASASKPGSLDMMFKKVGAGGVKELPIIIKGDVQGSVEAIANSLNKLGTSEVVVRVLHQAVGGITESDVTLARASHAIIIGFNVRANAQAREAARTSGVEVRYYSIIYQLVDEMKAAMSGMLSPVVHENILGYAQVRDVFNLSKYGKVAGCYVTEGTIKKSANARLIRDNVVIYDGKLKALKRFKDDVREVGIGFECGISFENYEDIKVDDRIEAYELVEQIRAL